MVVNDNSTEVEGIWEVIKSRLRYRIELRVSQIAPYLSSYNCEFVICIVNAEAGLMAIRALFSQNVIIRTERTVFHLNVDS